MHISHHINWLKETGHAEVLREYDENVLIFSRELSKVAHSKVYLLSFKLKYGTEM